MGSLGGLGLGFLVVVVILFVWVSARTFVRSWRYREALKDERFEAVGVRSAQAHASTGDLVFFTAAAHPFHNSWVNRTLFTHVGVLVRGRDLLEAGVADDPLLKTPVVSDRIYVSESAEGITLAHPSGETARLAGGSYLVPLAPRLHGYNGIVYWAKRSEGHRLWPAQRTAVAKIAAELTGRPYPNRWAMIAAAVTGLAGLVSDRQCYQHAAEILNSFDSPPWPNRFFESPKGMDDAAHGRSPLYDRAQILQRLEPAP